MNPQELWLKVPERVRVELVSAGHTVVSAMVVEFGIQLTLNQDILTAGAFSKATLIACLAAIVRSGVKSGIAFVISKTKEAV